MKPHFPSARWLAAASCLALGGAALAQAPATPPPAPAPAAAAVDPQMQKVLDAYKALNPKPIQTLSAAEARKGPTFKDAMNSVLKAEGKPTEPEQWKVEDSKIPGPQGELAVRVYSPEGNGPFPALVYFHGGGFVLADKDVYDAGPRALSKQANAVVVSVDYRQAPEHRFPAAVDDAAAAFRYVAQNAKKWNIDPTKIAVGGESAGGNLATEVALRQAKTTGAKPVFQLLVYPFLSNDLTTASHVANGKGDYLVSNDALGWFWKNYLGSTWQQSKNPEALPLNATNEQLKKLPPALVITAGLDPLKDDGDAYAKKLQAAGVKAEVKNYDGVTHEFFGMAPVLDKAKQAQADAANALKAAFQAQQGVGGAGPEAQ